MNTSRFFLAVGAVLSMALVACGGAAEEEELGFEEAELGEIGCATVGGTPYSGIVRNGRSTTPTACGTTEYFRSSSSTYDNGLTCSAQYVAEVRNIQGRALSIAGVWREDVLPMPLDNCGGGKIEIASYARNASTGVWDTHVSKLYGTNFFNLFCLFVPEAGYTYPPHLTNTHGYDTLRVAVSSTFTTLPGRSGQPPVTQKMPAGVDVHYPPSPC